MFQMMFIFDETHLTVSYKFSSKPSSGHVSSSLSTNNTLRHLPMLVKDDIPHTTTIPSLTRRTAFIPSTQSPSAKRTFVPTTSRPTTPSNYSGRVYHRLTTKAFFEDYTISPLQDSIYNQTSWGSINFSAKDAPARINSHLKNVNCPAMIAGEKEAIVEGKRYMYGNKAYRTPAQDIIDLTENCEDFKKLRGYYTIPLSQEEFEFPIAFSILMYKDVGQVERLLRAIYHPQNYYCINIDGKADKEIHDAMQGIADCFPNVLIPEQKENIHWGHISIVYAEIACMEVLMRYKWKYFINLSGQMFPLQSNRELVKILKLYDGANDVEGTFKRWVH